MNLFIEIVFIFITVVLILVVLLQAGRGGGLGTALGGGASQGVFGGGGGADFLAKLTQGLATGFMVCAVYLAYASAHTGSERLKDASDDTQEEFFDDDTEVDYERVGEGTPQVLPEAGSAALAPTAIVPEPPIEIPAEEDATPPTGTDEVEGATQALPATEVETPAEVVETTPADSPTADLEFPGSDLEDEGEGGA